MRKYHLADALTAFEVLMAFTLLGMAFYQVSADITIWIFIAGELADALDGPCARRWPYPDDGKFRWWRVPKTVKRIEHCSDIFIAVSCMLYLLNQPGNIPLFGIDSDLTVSRCATYLGLFIILFCSFAEAVIRTLRRLDEYTYEITIKIIILIRRLVYAFIGIGGGVFLLIMATSWSFMIQINVVFIGILAGFLLLMFKIDRATDPS